MWILLIPALPIAFIACLCWRLFEFDFPVGSKIFGIIVFIGMMILVSMPMLKWGLCA